jgi:hypothetical protein
MIHSEKQDPYQIYCQPQDPDPVQKLPGSETQDKGLLAKMIFKHEQFLNFNYALVKARTMVRWRGSGILNAGQTTVCSPPSTR